MAVRSSTPLRPPPCNRSLIPTFARTCAGSDAVLPTTTDLAHSGLGSPRTMSGVRFECVLTVGVTTNDPFDSHQLGPKWESPGTNQFSNAHDQHPRLFPLLLVFLAVVLAAWWAGKVWGRKKEARRSVGMVQTNLKYHRPSNVSPPLRLRSPWLHVRRSAPAACSRSSPRCGPPILRPNRTR